MFKILTHFRNLAIISFACLILGWSLPVQADTKLNPQLEQQVLEIIRKNPEIIIEAVEAYQQKQQQKLQQSRQGFINDFQANPQAVIGDSPTTGATKSKTVLIEFSDFECPYCAEAQKELKDLLVKYPNKFTLVYKHFPLYQIHEQALPAATAAWAAYQQGKFWEYHDALFTNQKQLGETLYLDTAKKLNLNLTKFNSDRKLANNPIQKDLLLAQKLGLGGTPSFIMSSQNFAGPVKLTEVEAILQGKQ
ncbi:DsbA family protein [Dolichospermum sp. ST_sed1]|nr:DsbA family protein [Dolichospermum sp. ST_sed1]MDD1426223.1 DsbA family protein [Dolichospermum sp. ST_sed9]MDD1432734.1 DsbA family protein [Dolichospermum sp. ST_sed6]MDD1437177.1 DsbA family protein [Dolichospermum sp. ST_sed10]MDD1442340.1 DsbA family protein [Dolichospermum sp. ST_sed3]MDD1456476.1 DsbA family protein [Dolichospermum sp. ST_sed7]MDD1461955.1 DsbA family protein [Dolichospermum sp. ST_sed2]MDD1466693.1 DsbA family protein [Dolichospermum sp. ST_sed5]MDD1473072.1 Dsb